MGGSRYSTTILVEEQKINGFLSFFLSFTQTERKLAVGVEIVFIATIQIKLLFIVHQSNILSMSF